MTEALAFAVAAALGGAAGAAVTALALRRARAHGAGQPDADGVLHLVVDTTQAMKALGVVERRIVGCGQALQALERRTAQLPTETMQ